MERQSSFSMPEVTKYAVSALCEMDFPVIAVLGKRALHVLHYV